MRTQVHDFKNKGGEKEDKKTRTSRITKGNKKKKTHTLARNSQGKLFFWVSPRNKQRLGMKAGLRAPACLIFLSLSLFLLHRQQWQAEMTLHSHQGRNKKGAYFTPQEECKDSHRGKTKVHDLHPLEGVHGERKDAASRILPMSARPCYTLTFYTLRGCKTCTLSINWIKSGRNVQRKD